MLIGVLSDIHGNSVALRAVLAEARQLGIKQLFILGDLIGYYYDAKGVFDLLDPWDKSIVRGNHEDMLSGLVNKKIDTERIRKKYGSGTSLAALSLSSERLNTLLNLPMNLNLKIDGLTVLMSHGSPWDTNQYIYPDADPILLDRCDIDGVDFVFLGHTHYPFIHKGRYSYIVNPGSVGQSRVKGGVANWGILDTKTKFFTAVNTSFDTSLLKREAKLNDPDVPYLVSILDRNNP